MVKIPNNKRLALILMVILITGTAHSQAPGRPGHTPPNTSPIVIADGSLNPASVPAWLSWKVFHDSLAFYHSKSPQATEAMLISKFNLTIEEASFLLVQGQAFVSQLQAIDSEARAYVQAIYGVDRQPSANLPRPKFRTKPAVISGKPIQIPPGARSLREALKNTGYLDQVENRKSVALSNHLNTLLSRMNPDSFAKVQSWVLTEVAKKIKVVELGVKVAGVPREQSPKGIFFEK